MRYFISNAKKGKNIHFLYHANMSENYEQVCESRHWRQGLGEVTPACWRLFIYTVSAPRQQNPVSRDQILASLRERGGGTVTEVSPGARPLQRCFLTSLPNTPLHGTMEEGTGEQDHILGKLARLVMPQALFLFRAKRIYPLFPQLSPQLFLIIQCLFPFCTP